MASMNKAILMGRLTADPEIRYTANEKPVAHFSIAVDRPTKDGEKSVDFINCVAWEGLAKVCGEWLKKGRLVAIEGRIQVRKYQDKAGKSQTWTEIVAKNLQILEWAKKEKAAK